MQAYDVGVIGAGIHGASAAYHLASRGVKTVVFEKGSPAGGPTGRSSGVCRAYYTNEFLARTAREGMEILANFGHHTNGADAGFRLTGFLFLHPEEDAAGLPYAAAHLRELGVAVDLLGRERLADEVPWFDLDG